MNQGKNSLLVAGLLLLLLFSMVYLGWQLRAFSLEGRDCVNNPYAYAENNIDKYGTPTDYCLYQFNKNLNKSPKTQLFIID